MSTALLTAADVAKRLGVSESWVRDHTRRDGGRPARRRPELPAVRLGGAVRYRAEAVEAWLQRLEAAA